VLFLVVIFAMALLFSIVMPNPVVAFTPYWTAWFTAVFHSYVLANRFCASSKKPMSFSPQYARNLAGHFQDE